MRHGMARLRWPPRCSLRPRRMRVSVTASISRLRPARCWRRCFTRRRSREAASIALAAGWDARSSPSPRRSSAKRMRRSRWRSFPGSPRRPSGTTGPRCSAPRRSRSPGPPAQLSERPPTPRVTPQIDLGELIAQQGTLYVVSPSRIQQELAPLIAALLDGLCAQAIDLAITSPSGRLKRPVATRAR